MKKFEYLQFLESSYSTTSIQDSLNEFGRNGWELVNFVSDAARCGTVLRFFFKREID
jgi:hypothetical protein